MSQSQPEVPTKKHNIGRCLYHMLQLLRKGNKITKKFLDDNRVYFETAAATMLAAMAIVISCQQCNISASQTRIMKTQEDIQREQLKLAVIQSNLTEKQVAQAINFNDLQAEILNKQLDLSDKQYSHTIKNDEYQSIISDKQLKNANKQLFITELQQQKAEQDNRIQQRAEYLILQDALMTVINKLTYGGVYFGTGKRFDDMSKEERLELLNSMIETLTINRNNQILLANDDVYAVWKSSALKLQLCKDLLSYNIKHFDLPDDTDPKDLAKYQDSPERRLKFVKDILGQVKKKMWELKDKFLVDQK